MKRFVSLFLLSVLCLMAQALWADNEVTYYSCDFEDAEEMQNWVLNVGTKGRTSPNKWYVGAAGSFGPNSQNGLYISTADDTTTAAYTASVGGFIVAYRPLNLETGNYSLLFDWIGNGKDADAIYVCYLPASTATNSNHGTSVITPPTWIPSSAATARGGEYWQSCTGNITADGNPGKLAIVFYYAQGVPLEPSFAIDNILIQQNACSAPTNVRFDRKTNTMSWMGISSSWYDVFVLDVYTNTSLSYEGILGRSFTIPDPLADGYYRCYVRQHCMSTSYSAWSSTYAILVSSQCIDYLDLTPDNSGAAKCYWSTDKDDYDQYMYQHAGQIDYGSSSELSRHTIHYKKGETDPRTGGQLKTIPDDEIASVRINGSRYQNQAEWNGSTVEYEYVVESDAMSQLKLRFASVHEYCDTTASFGGHSKDGTARFMVDIRSAVSGEVFLRKVYKWGYGDTLQWHYLTANEGFYWLDWQTIYFPLSEHIGDSLIIRFTANNCKWGGHEGYAYFTLGCKQFESFNTDCWNFDIDHFTAPEGYLYRWYKADEDSVALSDSSVLYISKTDTAIYMLDLISLTDSTDQYTLTANPNPVGPRAEVQEEVVLSDTCYLVTFTNRSHVARVNRVTGVETPEDNMQLLSLMWDFGDGTPLQENKSAVVTHTYPKRGGDYTVRVYAAFGDRSCVDTLEIPLSLAQGEYMLTTISKHGAVTKSGVYEVNSRIPLEATPDEGFEFVMWSDGSAQNPHVLTITQDTTIWALYSKVNTSWELRADEWIDNQLQMSWAGIEQAEQYDLNLFYDARHILTKEIEADGSDADVQVLADGLEAEMTYIYSLDAWQGAMTAMDAKSGQIITPLPQTDLIRVHDENTDEEAPAYNILGQPVDDTYHGIVIRNGRKHVQ